jgi:hypothetical protein
VAGPLASSPRRTIAACPGPRMHRNTAWRGHRPPPHAGAVGRPPRLLHAPCMQSLLRVTYLALLRSKGEENSISSTPRQRNLLLPCRRLPSSTVTTSSALAPYAPPPASSSTSRAPPCPGVPHRCHTRFLRPKPDAHRMYAQDQVVIHTVRM